MKTVVLYGYTATMENQMEKNMADDMETGFVAPRQVLQLGIFAALTELLT